MKLAIGADHAGFSLKEKLKKYLQDQGHEVKDFGCHSEQSVDYPDFAHPVSNAVEKKEVDFGILMCGSGNGINMTANKHTGIRAALCWNSEIAKLSRQHNNANILTLPARFIEEAEAIKCVAVFLVTPFEGGRHEERVKKISC
ncbi:MAG: ribose 5-phosphate isomerase B [Bacteroidetes bacterium]|nr:MAG: ribose 5-phosphate isomerase B [Bacteroidota bacterium]